LSRQESLYSTRRLQETLSRRGHQVRVVDPLAYPLIFGGRTTVFRPADATQALIPRIGASITALGCAVVRAFQQQGVWSLNPAEAITCSRDKLLSVQLLSSHQVPVPRTAVVSHPRNLPQAIEEVGGLPVVLKLRRGTQGKGVILVRTLSAAWHAYAVLNDFQQYTLVQEYVAEARNRDMRVIVVGDQAVAAMERQAPPGDFRANIHRGGSSRAIRLDPATAALAVKAVRVHGLGLAGVDLILTARGIAVIEVNSSPGLEGIEAATGTDIADVVAGYVEAQVVQVDALPVK